MLSAAIEKIQTLFSKHVLLSSFYPILIFTFVNLFLVYQISPRFRRWLVAHDPHADLGTVLQGTVVVVAIAVAAFFLSTVSYFLRELVEGKHWPEELSRIAIRAQRERLEILDQKIQDASRLRFQLHKQFANMPGDLLAARAFGTKNHPNACTYPASLPKIDSLRQLRAHGEAITPADMQNAVAALSAVLRTNDADAVAPPSAADAAQLDTDHVALVELLDYARAHAQETIIDLYGARRAQFGDAPVRPTVAGNMVNAVASYALSRYGFSIDLLWSRLQAVMPKDNYGTLQDAKAELDSLIALWWLALFTTVVWWIVSAVLGVPMLFFGIAIAGPLTCALLHFLVLSSYRGFHDLLRTAVDLNRFDLLKALHLQLPEGPYSEKNLWSSVAQLAEYGRDVSAVYKHP